MKNYRPISTLPSIGKIFERLIHVRLYSFFFKKPGVFHEDIFGISKNKSTHDAILSFPDDCYTYFDNQIYLI